MSTPLGRAQIPKAYDPKQVEGKWYRLWSEAGYFTPRIEPGRKPFVIIMPPPNITGELHLGHALTAALEDLMTRWHRMRGEPALWLPGEDHAGIAAQNAVEQALAAKGQSRHELGRERFLELMWEWAGRYRQRIADQHRRLGASCDWTRERFTMDPGPSRAVRTTFVNLYKKGLIYRGERLINWCPRCATALSDLEVEHEEVATSLWYVRYPLAPEEGAGGPEDAGTPQFITVATTRPETILGDTAVAVNPDDERYRALVGRKAILPAVKRLIPIIADPVVDPSFGTGAVKVTPAHDPVDFEIAQRHGLPMVNILHLDATMNENAGPYQGLDRFACRRALVADLEKEGLLVKTEPYHHSVGHCQRCRTIVEPLLSKQWFVKVAPLAAPATRAVLEGHIKIIPERFTKVYLNWMENIRDWCISRQLWWGHRIPVWYCGSCGEITVAVADPTECAACRSPDIAQDPDVLDTWFSSGLWPHSTLGWPDRTEDLSYFYPTSVMETSYDILFFWVARMIMLGLENTGQVPFHTVYLHGLIRDERGEKMSKSRGNVLDPLELMELYGTDALRFALTTGTSPGNDMKLSTDRLEASRNFANKLWNAARFILNATEGVFPPLGPPLALTNPEDRWVLSRLNRVATEVGRLMGDYQFGEAQRLIHDFLWGEFCDWYIEMAKIRLRQGDQGPLPVLAHVLEATLRLLHPFMPFITEELWQSLRGRLAGADGPASIMVAPYPVADEGVLDSRAEQELERVMDIVRAIRNFRAEARLDASRWVEAMVEAGEHREAVAAHAAAIEALARARPLAILEKPRPHPEGATVLVLRDVQVVLPRSGPADLSRERERLEKEMARLRADAERLEAKLADAAFLAKAPAPVVGKERQRLAECRDKLARLGKRRAALG